MPYAVKKYSRNKQGFFLSKGDIVIKTDTKTNAEFFAKNFGIAEPFCKFEVVKIEK